MMGIAKEEASARIQVEEAEIHQVGLTLEACKEERGRNRASFLMQSQGEIGFRLVNWANSSCVSYAGVPYLLQAHDDEGQLLCDITSKSNLHLPF